MFGLKRFGCLEVIALKIQTYSQIFLWTTQVSDSNISYNKKCFK